jgi:hypothetical protein
MVYRPPSDKKLPACASSHQGGMDRPAVHLALNCVWERRIIIEQYFIGCSLLCPSSRGKWNLPDYR